MLDYEVLSSTPINEDCVQVSSNTNYLEPMREECSRYKQMLIDRFPIPEYLAPYVGFAIKRFDHDFGGYYEVVIKYNTDNEEAVDFMVFVENNLPETWDDTKVMDILNYEVKLMCTTCGCVDQKLVGDGFCQNCLGEIGEIRNVWTEKGRR